MQIAKKNNNFELFDLAKIDTPAILSYLSSQLTGLDKSQVKSRLKKYGLNTILVDKQKTKFSYLVDNIKNPLILLLISIGIISFLTKSTQATIFIFLMLVIGITLRLYQEIRSDNAAKKLRAMVVNTATVIRQGAEIEIELKKLVPGDIIKLSAGDMIPADIRILTAKDLFVNQTALTGESFSAEKKSGSILVNPASPFDLTNMGFLGSSVESGSATAIIVYTGKNTYLGSLASTLNQQQLTSFDKGINQFTWMMIKFIIIMVPIVFIINIIKHDWFEAFLFTLALAIGLTPEMLPMIVTVNLSKGALAMARKKAIVKHLNSIQNLGAMDILCTDKTGTITKGKIILEKHIDITGAPNDEVLNYGYINSHYHTGLKNLLDDAILNHENLKASLKINEKYHKIDEIPFDFKRRRMSVVVDDNQHDHTLICKGAVEEFLKICVKAKINNKVVDLSSELKTKSKQLADSFNQKGYRVIAVGYKKIKPLSPEQVYTVKDEMDLILLGFLAFLDPPKTTAIETLIQLRKLNIDVKILTGDNEIVTKYICQKVGISTDNILLGNEIETMTDKKLATIVNDVAIFAKLIPTHKERIIKSLQSNQHTVGFLGDGINDAAALKAADVGISVKGAVDIAKESSDIILLETSLLILKQGVLEGRKVFGNIIKYIKMAASSNFGNMLSFLGASIFLPFLPMLPLQILINNLLYDFSQTVIPSDGVDEEWIQKPRKWAINKIRRFILFIGPISSIFDYLTFFVMLYIFNCWNNPALFQTSWFIESIFTQTLIIHVIRTNKIPFIESRASWPLMTTSILIVAISSWLVVSPFANALGFVALPSLYWLFLASVLISYITLTQIIKSWFVRKFGE